MAKPTTTNKPTNKPTKTTKPSTTQNTRVRKPQTTRRTTKQDNSYKRTVQKIIDRAYDTKGKLTRKDKAIIKRLMAGNLTEAQLKHETIRLLGSQAISELAPSIAGTVGTGGATMVINAKNNGSQQGYSKTTDSNGDEQTDLIVNLKPGVSGRDESQFNWDNYMGGDQ